MILYLNSTDDGRTPPYEEAYISGDVYEGTPLKNTGEQVDGIMQVTEEDTVPTYVSLTDNTEDEEENPYIRVTRLQSEQVWEILLDDHESLPSNFEETNSYIKNGQEFHLGRFAIAGGEGMPPSTQADEGKFLRVDSNGVAGWEEVTAADLPVEDVGGYFESDNIEDILQELGAELMGVDELIGGDE